MESPIFGSGIAKDQIDKHINGANFLVREPHNFILKLVIEVGLIGLILFIIPFIIAFKSLIRSGNIAHDDDVKLFIYSILFYLIIFFTDALFHNHLDDNTYWLFLSASFFITKRKIINGRIENFKVI